MDNQVKETSGQPDHDGGAVDRETQTVVETNDSVERPHKDTVAYDTYRKVLGEAKRSKSELAELRAKVESFEHRDLESKGKQNEVIEALRKRNEELKSAVEEKDKRYAWNVVGSQIKLKAAEMGCVDTEALIKLGDFGAVQVDDEFNVNKDDLALAIEDAQKKYDYLFKRPAPSVKDLPPSSKAPESKNGKGTFEGMTLKEMYALLAENSVKGRST